MERKRHNYRNALKYYSACLECNPNNNYAYFGIADCYKSLNQLPDAIQAWEHYIAKDPQNISVLSRIADAYRKLKNFPKSKYYYLNVLEVEEDNAYALIGLGHLHFDFKEYESALMYWEKVYKKNPGSVDIRILTSIGNCHRKLKTFQDGLIYFKLALELEPSNFFALFGMADCYRGLQDYGNSLIYWLKILQNDPTNKVILTRAGDAYRVLGELQKAENMYNQALAIEFDAYAVLGLSLIFKAKGQYDKAILKIRSLIKQDKKNHRLYIEIAKCYLDQGDIEKALITLQEYQDLGIYNIYVSDFIEKIKRSR